MSSRYHNQKPNSRRFEVFDEFTDGSGFTIKEGGRSIDFFYDKFRGWFDESGNYYNKDGVWHRHPTKESLDLWHTIKHKYDDDEEDDLLKDYEQGLDFHDDSDDFDDDEYAIDDPDPEDLEEIIREQNRRKDDRGPPKVTVTRNQNPPQREEVKKQEEKPKPRDQAKPRDQPKPAQVVKVQVQTQEPVKQAVQQPQPQQTQQKQQQEATKQAPIASGPKIYLTGLSTKDQPADFEKWLIGKTKSKTWNSIDHRDDKEQRFFKITFDLKEHVEDLIEVLKPLNGKISYKGKVSLTYKIVLD